MMTLNDNIETPGSIGDQQRLLELIPTDPPIGYAELRRKSRLAGADLDGDDRVGVTDLLIVLRNFGGGAAACLDNADCDDDDACTFDLCILGTCFHFPIPNCP